MADRKKSIFQRLTNGRLNRKQRRELERKLSADDPGGAAHAEKHGHDEPPVVECDRRYRRSHRTSHHAGDPGRRTQSGEVGKPRDRREDMPFDFRQAVDAYDFIQKRITELPAREVDAAAVAPEAAGKPAR